MTETGPDASDGALVAIWLGARDEGAFRTLYRRHTPALFGLLLRLSGGRREEAEDTAQEAWLRAARALSEFRWESSLRTWLTGIAIRCWRERARAAGRRPAATPGEGAADRLPAPALEADRALDLDRAVADLPGGAREVLVLHDIEGYTHREIGTLLGIDPGTSKSQLSRARRRLRTALAGPAATSGEGVER